MDLDKIMIIIKGKEKTEEVSYYKVGPSGVQIIYRDLDIEYNYRNQDVLIFQEPYIQEPGDNIAIYHDDVPFNNVKRVWDFGVKIRICFENASMRVYDKDRIRFEQNVLSKPDAKFILEYWREISTYVKNKDEIEEPGTHKEKESFLSKEFAKLNYVDPNSVLGQIIQKNPIKQEKMLTVDPVFPFSFNLSQKKALEHALTSNISIIEGPPGTGKTQTILNIIANLAIMQGKKVAVVSSNNAAVLNVQEKLERKGYHFFVASLGNQENKKKFFVNLPKVNMSDWDVDISEAECRDRINHFDRQLHRLMEMDREKAQCKQKLSAYLLEQEHFEHYFARQDVSHIEKLSFYKQTPNKILEFMKDSFLAVEIKKKYKLFYPFKLFFKHGFTDFKKLKKQGLDVILNYQRQFYILRIEELSNQILKIEEELKSYNYQDLLDDHQHCSENLFRLKLHKKYHNRSVIQSNEKSYIHLNLFKDFIENYPVVLSTTHSLRNCVPPNYMFDYCIIDESSQVDLLTGALALSCCKHAIIVGDTKQLPHIVDLKIKEKLKNSLYPDMSSAYDYFEHNVLSSLLALYGDTLPSVILREHYRCHPAIIEFCNRKYYNGDLITFTDPQMSDSPLMIYRTAMGNHMRKLTHGKKGRFNSRELEVIEQEILQAELDVVDIPSNIGFTTPYRKQLEKAVQHFTVDIESDTIHRYQGREKDTMIMSTVLDRTKLGNMGMKFVNNPNLINVAVSRAQRQFILVTDHSAFHRYGNEVGDLMRYMEYSTLDDNVVESEIVSIFDLLYREYSEKLREFRNRASHYNNSRYKSENLMEALLTQILEEPQFKDFTLSSQVYLMNIFVDLDRLNEEERKFIKHFSSVDFAIYHKLDRSLALAIEVDGFEFHENKPDQIKRDEIKEAIFRKFGLTLARFKTNESGEEQKIINLLNGMIDPE
ncbi:AAA domain-containing protein [Paenibacillus amylolyticus]|uniref:AAA domain-containing protein n=1 Tax=Paenibacillus amylolyticus TaxID=1451 RepID=UPI0039B01D72